jgi:hypothetical protein
MDNVGVELFADEREVEPTASDRAGLWRALVVLLGAGVLLAGVVVAIVSLVTALGSGAVSPGCRLSAASCDELTVAEAAELTAIPFPAGSTVLDAGYSRSATDITVDATVLLPAGSANPFDGSAYFEVDSASIDLPARLEPIGYYSAVGELGALNAEAVYADAVSADGGQQGGRVVVVRVHRDLG